MAFEQFLTPPKPPSRWRRLTYVVSISMHVVLLVAGGFRSVWRVEEISPKGVAVTFLSGLTTPPAPPPPPPPAQKSVATPEKPRHKPRPVQQPKPEEVVQPREEPIEEPAEAGGDEGEPEGVAGGMENGLSGGVVGSVEAVVPPPPPKPAAEPPPLNISPRLGAGQRLSDVNDPRYRPSLPPALNRPGMVVRGFFKICVSREGQVSDVKMLNSPDPDVANGWTTVIRRWQYKPLTVDGKPTRFCHPLMLEVQSVR
jgi:hypothetical protein